MPTIVNTVQQLMVTAFHFENANLNPQRIGIAFRENPLQLFCRKPEKNRRKLGKARQKNEKFTEHNIGSLQKKIEHLRLQLHQLTDQKGFLDQSVIELSQKLDDYIVLYQHLTHYDKKT